MSVDLEQIEEVPVEPVVITEPGVYELDEGTYHADPVPDGSLSASMAKTLLADGGPAKLAYQREHPSPPSKAMNFGSAVHKLALGFGPKLVLVDFPNYLKAAAKQEKADALAAGNIPVLPFELEAANEMAAALQQHPVAAALLDTAGGLPERSLFVRDPETGLWLRGRTDWMPHPKPGRRLILPDFKTGIDASPFGFAKAVARFGYHLQAAHYKRLVELLGLADDVAFVFIVQETSPPYLVSVFELSPMAMAIGAHEMRRAIEIYQTCRETGVWPGYGDDVAQLDLPAWMRRQYEGVIDV